jgi:hypothetical protein
MTDQLLIGNGAPSRIVHITATPKGGAGKTETADVLEAALFLSGSQPILIDVDDGNRGLTRRVGKEHVLGLNWASGPEDAPGWLRHHAAGSSPLIFDLGAGLMSTDLPILNFLATVWRMLHDEGAKIVIYCIVSTNAPTARFIQQMVSTYGRIAEVVLLRNDQDGSGAFPADIADRSERQLTLDHLAGGIQAVRLLTKAPLSTVIAEPPEGYGMATRIMAAGSIASRASLRPLRCSIRLAFPFWKQPQPACARSCARSAALPMRLTTASPAMPVWRKRIGRWSLAIWIPRSCWLKRKSIATPTPPG